jgi:hypothetical protein
MARRLYSHSAVDRIHISSMGQQMEPPSQTSSGGRSVPRLLLGLRVDFRGRSMDPIMPLSRLTDSTLISSTPPQVGIKELDHETYTDNL